jgi:hypothetical protein
MFLSQYCNFDYKQKLNDLGDILGKYLVVKMCN